MKTEDLSLFLTAFSLTVAFATLADFLRKPRLASGLQSLIALLAVVIAAIAGEFSDPTKSYASQLWQLVRHGDVSSALAVLMGFAAGFVWPLRFFGTSVEHTSSQRWKRNFIVDALYTMSLAAVVAAVLAFLWKGLFKFERDYVTQMYAPGFAIEKVATLHYFPTRIASCDNGNVYVTCDYFEEWGDMGGVIIQLSRTADADHYEQKVAAESPLLIRSYGLAARNDALYVSRSGISGRAQSGKVTYDSIGTVTQLKDLDNDGYFEFAHDIVTGLPGVRGPDTMQQNNGIAFASDGSLFVTNACATNRSLDDHPWAGTVLRVSPDFQEVEVYARGFRNPFGVTIDPEDHVFVTDNDVDANPGDELNHVVQGAHYGHPFVVADEAKENSGFHGPILVSEAESSYQGLVYATSPNLPAEYRNCIYMTDFMENKIVRVALERQGDSFRVTGVYPFAAVSTPVDITVTHSGEFFVVSRQSKQIVRIRPRVTKKASS